jgi:hypothetical protein
MKERQSEEIFVGPMSPLRNLFLENVKLLGSLRSVATIRDKVLDLIFSITPADRAAIFVDHTLTTRARESREQSVSINREIIDRVLKGGPGVLVNEPPMSMLCLPMDTLEDRIGVIYAESSNPEKPLNEVNFDMISGVAPIVAMAVDHVAVIELLDRDCGDRHPELGLTQFGVCPPNSILRPDQVCQERSCIPDQNDALQRRW